MIHPVQLLSLSELKYRKPKHAHIKHNT